MANKPREYDWLDDPFDERKEAEDLEEIRSSKQRGCLIGIVVAALAFIIVSIASCGALATIVSL